MQCPCISFSDEKKKKKKERKKKKGKKKKKTTKKKNKQTTNSADSFAEDGFLLAKACLRFQPFCSSSQAESWFTKKGNTEFVSARFVQLPNLNSVYR